MRIAIQTLGTRGDVQPFIALGKGLRAAGVEVTLATAPQFEAFVTQHGLEFAPLPGDLIDLLQTPAGRSAVAGRNKLAASWRLLREIRPMFRRLLDAQWAAARGADVLVFHPKAVGGIPIAEKLGIPALLALPLPGLSPTARFPNPLLPVADLGPLNRASHWLVTQFGDLAFRRPVRRWSREVLGLPATGHWLRLRGKPIPKLYAYSPAVVPVPEDWDSSSIVTGYWILDETEHWKPPADLLAFIEAGSPPVYVGFGSLPVEDAERTTDLVIEALRIADQRGILATGWGGLKRQEGLPDVHFIEGAPHEWLFPRVAAVVHHGGAGTTAAGLRAGKPSVICPFFGDQYFWGQRVQALGAGLAPIPQRRLTPQALSRAIVEAVHNPSIRACTARLGDILKEENGVATAVARIETTLLHQAR